MAKFHINAAGDPGLCRAEKDGCPFGGDSEHHESAAAARKAHELNNADYQVATHKGDPSRREIDSYMPEKFKDYFADTEKKHFDPNSAGSTFTSAKNLKEILKQAHIQRGDLEGDDREKLISRGADPTSFQSGKRYLMMETQGNLGTVHSNELSDDDILTVVQKSEKSKPVCVVERKSKAPTDFATIVLVDNPTLPGTEGTKTLLITAYPGASGPSSSNNDLLPYVGKKITTAQGKEIYGREFTVNTILPKD